MTQPPAASRRSCPSCATSLTLLRRPIQEWPAVDGPVARRMLAACTPFADLFVTPMAAVAGAVADELLAHMTAAARLERAFVNDGGDIAILVSEGHALEVGVAGEFSRGDVPVLNGRLRLEAGSGIGGIATSGARGRSFSLGIADSVTVLAGDAATADIAATLVANAVDIDSPAVKRRPARDLDPDSDLGDSLVTVAVGALTHGRDRHGTHPRRAARARLPAPRSDRRRRAHARWRDPHARRCAHVSSRPERSSEPGPSRRGRPSPRSRIFADANSGMTPIKEVPQ